MGVQLVPRGRYQQAIAVLDAVCEVYPFNESFIAGQVQPYALAQGVLQCCWALHAAVSWARFGFASAILLTFAEHSYEHCGSGQETGLHVPPQVRPFAQTAWPSSASFSHACSYGVSCLSFLLGLKVRDGSCHLVSCVFTILLMCALTTLGRRAAQLALASYLGVLNNEAALLGHLDAAIGGGRSCLAVPVAGGGAGAVCLLPCLRWNYCHDDQSCCTSPGRLPLGLTSTGALERAGTAVLHQARARAGAPADAFEQHDAAWVCGRACDKPVNASTVHVGIGIRVNQQLGVARAREVT